MGKDQGTIDEETTVAINILTTINRLKNDRIRYKRDLLRLDQIISNRERIEMAKMMTKSLSTSNRSHSTQKVGYIMKRHQLEREKVIIQIYIYICMQTNLSIFENEFVS